MLRGNMAGRIRSEVDGPIGWLVVSHPERRNALTAEMWRQLPVAASALDADPNVRVIVLRGEGDQAFVSGADISEFNELRVGQTAAQYESDNERAFIALSTVKKPVLTLIHGFCIGGGVAISVSTDLRYAAEDAVFGVPAARLGLSYPLSGVEALIQLVGFSHAKDLFFTARRIDAQTALRMGLVNEVLPKSQLETRVRELALQIADNAPLTLRAVKTAAIELAKPAQERDRAAMLAAARACFDSRDYGEGVQAFLGKRRPKFEGR
jgi:enoyl-CoA hydratase